MSDETQGKLRFIELEQQVLGTILIDSDLAHSVEAEWFSEPAHVDLIEAIKRRLADGDAASPVTLGPEANSMETASALGGATYLVRCAGFSSKAAFQENVREIKNLWARRKMAETLEGGVQAITSFSQFQSPDRVINEIEAAIATVTTIATRKPLVESSLAGMTDAIRMSLEAKASSGVVGTSTGIGVLDQKIGGMAAGDMIVLAGRPSMGKTALALAVAWKVAQSGKGVFFGSLEMLKAQLWTRFLSMELHERGEVVPYFDIRTGRVSDEVMARIGQIAQENQGLPFMTGEKECRNMSRLRSASRRAARMFEDDGLPLGLVVIDYLQLIEGDRGQSDYARVSAASNGTKALAIDLNVPVLVLSQLNRGVEARDEPIPRLSDLRESGKVEEDADIVMLAYRPAYYIEKRLAELEGSQTRDALEERNELTTQLSQTKDQARLLIPKARGGATGEVTIGYRPETNRVWER